MLEPEAGVRTSADGEALSVTRAQAQAAAAWDQFVNQHPQGRFCHLWGYTQVLEKAYGYKCVRLNFSAGERVGLFPSIVVRRGSRRLVSQPFNLQ